MDPHRPDAALPPVWLLDVDGVLNAVTRSPARDVWPDWRRGSAEAEGVTWPVCFSPTVAGAIRALHDSGLAEVRWLTTWRAHANADLRRLLGLPELAVVSGDDPEDDSDLRPLPSDAGIASHGAATAAYRPAVGEWWKFTAVRRLVQQQPDRALVWTDDELAYQPEAVAWVRGAVSSPLLISPLPDTGLTAAHLLAIEEFCRLQTGRFG